jgi:predicted Zn finger-like uncharacterized protein
VIIGEEMIIQCRQCRIKFQFDDALMQGDGLWMRCSRCQHVFFQDNPLIIKSEKETPLVAKPVFLEGSTPTEKNADLSIEAAPISGRDEDVVRFLDNVMDVKKTYNKEVNLDMEKTIRLDINKEKFVAASRSATIDDLTEEYEEDEDFEQIESLPQKGFWKTWKVVIWVILVVVIIPFIIYFVVYPQYGERFIKIANQYISAPEPTRPEVVIGQVKLQDIRQRILNNYVLGQIRVMEGTAVNQADYPISRVVIKGAIVDAYAVVLGERISYAGNVLTDEELTNWPEEEILRRLSRPEGNNNSNDKIVPNGQIPFMIVFAREPAGVIKTTVTTIGAERLL